jgi:GNAT superfamily N-acetyltransferase
MSTAQDGTAIRIRPARPGEGQALFDVTVQSVRGLAASHYDSAQIAGWMGKRTSAYYEDIIARGLTVVAEENGVILGFADSEPGEVTRLFLAPEAAGKGLGKRLLAIGIENAAKGHEGPIRIESTLNAQSFYEHHGFRPVRKDHFSHSLGGDPIEIVVMEMARG